MRRARVERSTDQVVKPVNTEALAKWVGHIPDDVVEHMAEVAPMLARLGYDPRANPPDYARAPPLSNPPLVSFKGRTCWATVASYLACTDKLGRSILSGDWLPSTGHRLSLK